MFAEEEHFWNILMWCTLIMWLIIFFVFLGPCLMLKSSLQDRSRNKIKIFLNRASTRKTTHGEKIRTSPWTSSTLALGSGEFPKRLATTEIAIHGQHNIAKPTNTIPAVLNASELLIWKMACTFSSIFYDTSKRRRFYSRSFWDAETLGNISYLYKSEFVLFVLYGIYWVGGNRYFA